MAMTMGETSQPRTISKGRLKARMLEVFREIERKGEKLIVTDNGRPVLLIEPIGAKRHVDELFADLRGKVEYAEDINAPSSDEWTET
jgi:antitoxin (DNA-binding transcriptional repressor) of toxin-antitoxin stability system